MLTLISHRTYIRIYIGCVQRLLLLLYIFQHKCDGLVFDDESRILHNECAIHTFYYEGIGLAIYAGKDFPVYSEISRFPGIPIASNRCNNILSHYVEGHPDEGLLLISLGYALLFNHADYNTFPHIQKYSSHFSLFNDESKQVISLQYLDVNYTSTADIRSGDQIFNYYGENYFGAKQIKEISPYDYNNADYIAISPNRIATHPNRLPGCATAFIIMKSERLYASRNIRKGQVIEVTRALFLPSAHMVDAGLIERFLWYSHREYPNDKGGSDSVLLMLGYGALYSSVSKFTLANVDYAWYDPSSMSSDHGKTFMPSAAQCSDQILVSFTANRDIEAEEELIIDLKTVGLHGIHRYTTSAFSQYCFNSVGNNRDL